MPQPAVIQTRRLRLTPLADADVPELHRLWTSVGVRRHLWDGRVIAREQTRDLVARSQFLFEEQGYGLWGAREPEQAELIGFSGYWFFRAEHDLELLYGLDPALWGRGFGLELARGMVRYGVETLGLPEIRASTDPANVASVRILQRLGFLFDKRAVVQGLETAFYRLPRTLV
jgi:[ribosomal protein S5]-alanine N-acetyltransferase